MTDNPHNTNPRTTAQQMFEASLLHDSPLHEISRDSLQELFSRINDRLTLGLPEEIPDSDLDELIETYRARRFQFLAEQDRKASEPPKRRKKSAPASFDLSDLLDS